MRVTLTALLILVSTFGYSQTSLIGGVTAHFQQAEPLTKLDYFGGVEFKIQLYRNLKLYFTPQYNAVKIENYRTMSGTMPIGIVYDYNEMWDERTVWFRFIDVAIGTYGGYIFNVTKNEDQVTENFSMIDYGVQLSAKFRIFVFYPLYLSYNYGFSNLEEEGFEDFQSSYLQAGIYIPVSTLLKIY